MIESRLQIREFKAAEDYHMICQWADIHRHRHDNCSLLAPPVELLPAIGAIVWCENGLDGDDLAAMWLYLAQGCPICFLEHCVTKPGLPVAIAKRAIIELVNYMKFVAAKCGYRIMVAHVVAAFARYMERLNWHHGDDELIAMYTEIK